MKIKCPGCSSLLQIPDSAAGKVVKCQCGKQLRAPVPKGAAPSAGAASTGAAKPGGPARPAPSRPPAASAPTAGPGIFDELTETDLAPIRAVQMPGAKTQVKAPGATASKLLQDAISGSDRRAEGMMMRGEKPRPPFLIFLGVVNWLAALFYFGLVILFVGLVDMVPAMKEELPDSDAGVVFYLIAGMFGLMGAFSLATGIACFLRGKVAWYIVLVSYGWSLAFNLFDVIAKATAEDAGMGVLKGVGGILVGAAIWFWLHGESVREYYKIENEPLWRTVLLDVSGFVVAGGLGGAILLLR